MLNANQAKEMVITKTEEIAKEKRAKAQYWCDKIANEAIETAANECRYAIRVEIINEYQMVRGEIECILKKAGYSVELRDQGRMVEICWL